MANQFPAFKKHQSSGVVIVSVAEYNCFNVLKVDIQDGGVVTDQVSRSGVEQNLSVGFNQKRKAMFGAAPPPGATSALLRPEGGGLLALALDDAPPGARAELERLAPRPATLSFKTVSFIFISGK